MLLLVFLFFGGMGTVYQAEAGYYEVEQCTNNFGAALSSYSAETPSTGRFNFGDNCANASLRYLQGITNGSGATIPRDRIAYTAFYAPDGSGLVSGQYHYEIRSMNGVVTRVMANNGSATDQVVFKTATMGAAPISGTDYWNIATDPDNSTGNPRRIAFRVVSKCTLNPCSNPGAGNRPYYQLGHVRFKIDDYTPPSATLTGGSLFTNRVHGGTETVSMTAGDAQGGVRRVTLKVNGTTVDTHEQNCWVNWGLTFAAFTHGPCPSSVSDTFSVNTNAAPWSQNGFINDVKVCSEDLATTGSGNVTCSPSRVALVGGNSVHATLYDGNPSSGGTYLADEWLQLGTENSRREDLDATVTRQTRPCSTGVGGVCVDLRSEEKFDDGSAGDWELELYNNQNDPSIDPVSELSEVVNGNNGTVDQTGTLSSVKAAWQTAPPGSGTSYRLYRDTTTPEIDGVTQTLDEELIVDSNTGLPIVERRLVNGVVDSATYFTYEATSQAPTSSSDTDYMKAPSPDADSATMAVADPAPTAVTGSAAEAGDGDTIEDQALRFRTSVGLDTSPAAISTAAASATADEGIDEFGVPLTPAELTDMNERMELQDKLDEITEYGDTETPATFGGVWIDQLDDGTVKVAFTANAASHQDELENILDSDRVETFTVDENLTELLETRDDLRDAWEDLEGDGIDVTSIAIDVSQNDVVVGLDELNTVGSTAVEAFGDSVEPIEQPLPDNGVGRPMSPSVGSIDAQGFDSNFVYSKARVRNSGVPLPAGSMIAKKNGATCSSAFAVSRKVNNKAKYYILTASHCLTGRYYHNGQNKYASGLIGKAYDNFDMKQFDLMLISTAKKRATSRVLLDPAGGGKYLRMNDYMEAPRHELNYKGDILCRVGYRKSKKECGKVTDPNVDTTFSQRKNVHVYNLIETDIFARQGDSGGPLWKQDSNSAIGTFSGGHLRDNCNPPEGPLPNCPFETALFAPIYPIMDEFNLHMVAIK